MRVLCKPEKYDLILYFAQIKFSNRSISTNASNISLHIGEKDFEIKRNIYEAFAYYLCDVSVFNDPSRDGR